MSDNLPFEIQIEIMKRLPVKPLLQFRTVSKAWKTMIDSSHFIKTYNSQVQHLLLSYHEYCPYDQYQDHVSFVDDDTFPQQKVSPFVPELVKSLMEFRVIGCSHGLLCLKGLAYCPEDSDDNDPIKDMVVLWNVLIRKAVAVIVPYAESGYRNDLGFGVCSETNEPKIVNIKYSLDKGRNTEGTSFIPWQVEVFTVRKGAWSWRNVDNNFPRKTIQLLWSQVVIDELMYWLATDMSSHMIISFDITMEELREVNLPDSLARHTVRENLCISKLRKSLVVLERGAVVNNPSHIVWMMENGISETFTKLYNIYTPDASLSCVLGFRNNGSPILQLYEKNDAFWGPSWLAVYEPYTKCIKNTGIDGTELIFYASSYTETLHLHDQRNSTVWDYVNQVDLQTSR